MLKHSAIVLGVAWGVFSYVMSFLGGSIIALPIILPAILSSLTYGIVYKLLNLKGVYSSGWVLFLSIIYGCILMYFILYGIKKITSSRRSPQ